VARGIGSFSAQRDARARGRRERASLELLACSSATSEEPQRVVMQEARGLVLLCEFMQGGNAFFFWQGDGLVGRSLGCDDGMWIGS
jgi:hypothetical protein